MGGDWREERWHNEQTYRRGRRKREILWGLTENGGKKREEGIGESARDGRGWKKSRVWRMKRRKKRES